MIHCSLIFFYELPFEMFVCFTLIFIYMILNNNLYYNYVITYVGILYDSKQRPRRAVFNAKGYLELILSLACL